MKSSFFNFLAFLAFSTSFAQTEKNVGDFTKVTAFDQIDVTLVPGNENKVILTGANSNVVELINKNGELKVRMPLGKMLSGDDVTATVYFKKIDAVEANEGSRVVSKETIQSIDFDIITKEGSEVSLQNLQADKLTVRTSAGSIVTVKGTVKNQDVLANSGAKYDGQDCKTQQTTVTVNAGGMAEVNATDLVDAKTRAGGTITIHGKPKQINQKKIAGGTIEQVK
ncbi:head GIN domain-containing protein [Flavobacterium sp.]|uniref:head GIN domain-containing protein n=1 Tax=Flavobacterium sp. TaxID=239 RepID=UPI0035B070D5